MSKYVVLVVTGVIPHLQSWGMAGVLCQMQDLGHHCQKLAQAGAGRHLAALLNPACHLVQYPTQTYSQSITVQITHYLEASRRLHCLWNQERFVVLNHASPFARDILPPTQTKPSDCSFLTHHGRAKRIPMALYRTFNAPDLSCGSRCEHRMLI